MFTRKRFLWMSVGASALLLTVSSSLKADLPEALRYPKATSLESVGSSGAMESAVLVTEDPLDKVLAHYSKALACRIGGGESEVQVKDGIIMQAFAACEDSKQAFTGDKYPPRDVQLFTVTKLTKTEVISLVISRTKTDKQTHIVATWLKR
jgi:hypothetical protein